jgi:hypothetical protein
MTNDQGGRTPRQTTGGAPATSAIMIVVAVIAIGVGFFILYKIRNDSDSSAAIRPPSNSTVTTTTVNLALTTTTVGATTTTGLVVTGTSVEVVNASTGSGVAGKLTTELQGKGFTLAKATNGTGPKLAASVVYYDTTNPSAQPVANSVATLMGGIPVQAYPATLPITGGKAGTGVGVLVMLGNDRAGKTLAAMSGASSTVAAATATTTRAGATTTTAH